MKQELIIQADGLKKSYGDLEVLKGITFGVPKGTIYALLGPNGAGKTTTVRILTTLLPYDGGKATVNGFDVVDQADDVRRGMGLTGQSTSVDELLSGMFNLEMIGRLYGMSKADAKARAAELIERFDLVDAAHRMAKTYSGGMRRRLDLAASIITKPPVLFLDEPTTGLDPASRRSMWEIIKDLVADGTTVLLTTQYLEEADQLADRIGVIDHGVLIAEGTADELKAKVGGERLELTFADEDARNAAQKLFGKAAHINADTGAVTMEIKKGVSQIKEVLTDLEKAKITVDSFAMHRPTLDDVFLTLTGKATEEESK